MNTAAEHLLGISRRLSRGESLRGTQPSLDQIADLVEKTLSSHTGYSADIELPHLEQSAGETTLLAGCTVTPVRDGSVLVELSDATRRRQLDRENALRKQHGASRRISRQLAHEIRNPLGGLRGAAQLLESELPDPALTEYTRIIIGEADRLAGLMDDLLGPGKAMAREPVNVHQVLEHVASLVERESSVRLVRDYDPSLPAVLVDRDQLVQALLNLARNAFQAAGGDGEITFRSRALTNQVIGETRHRVVASLEVQDNGPGVPVELQESIFYPLVTGREDGTGLGLALAQDIINRHGGLIEFSSRPGRTVFMIKLPVVPGSEDSRL